jgi:hypothetical protein
VIAGWPGDIPPTKKNDFHMVVRGAARGK